MNRLGFIKSLFIASISPKILGELNISKSPIANNTTRQIFTEMNILTPIYLEKMVEKYGNKHFEDTINYLLNINNQNNETI